jgi:hypothetical protein
MQPGVLKVCKKGTDKVTDLADIFLIRWAGATLIPRITQGGVPAEPPSPELGC